MKKLFILLTLLLPFNVSASMMSPGIVGDFQTIELGNGWQISTTIHGWDSDGAYMVNSEYFPNIRAEIFIPGQLGAEEGGPMEGYIQDDILNLWAGYIWSHVNMEGNTIAAYANVNITIGPESCSYSYRSEIGINDYTFSDQCDARKSDFVSVPEPLSLGLIMLGLLGIRKFNQ